MSYQIASQQDYMTPSPESVLGQELDSLFRVMLTLVWFSVSVRDDIKSSEKISILNQFKIAIPPPSPSLS